MTVDLNKKKGSTPANNSNHIDPRVYNIKTEAGLSLYFYDTGTYALGEVEGRNEANRMAEKAMKTTLKTN